MTPILKPKNAGEVRYNTGHRRTRCVIERYFGLLKRRFPCLHLGPRAALANTLVIIVATAVLHNFAFMHREQDFDEDIENDVPFDVVAAADASGNAKRQLIISQFFLRDSLASETRARVKITPREKGETRRGERKRALAFRSLYYA